MHPAYTSPREAGATSREEVALLPGMFAGVARGAAQPPTPGVVRMEVMATLYPPPSPGVDMVKFFTPGVGPVKPSGMATLSPPGQLSPQLTPA